LRNHGIDVVIASMRLAGFADEGCDEAELSSVRVTVTLG
jgi:hypothetical protein